MITKFMGVQGFVWFIGVVEDNNDPDRLGRVRVRCYGFHTDNMDDLKTNDLPWATVMHPTTSSALRGRGSTPSLEMGTRVIGFFADGVSAQYPVIMGSIGGINNGFSGMPDLPPLTQNDLRIQQQEQQQQETSNVVGTVGPLSESQYRELREALGTRESGGVNSVIQINDQRQIVSHIDQIGSRTRVIVAPTGGTVTQTYNLRQYGATNQIGFIGKYQFGFMALRDIGLVNNNVNSNAGLRNQTAWKQGSLLDWYINADLQENSMLAYCRKNYGYLLRNGGLSSTSPPREVAGMLAMSHLLGAGSAATVRRTGVNRVDANNVSGWTYYRIGYSAITDSSPSNPNPESRTS